MAPKSNDEHPYKRIRPDGDRREGHVQTEAETGGMRPQAGDTWGPQKLKESGKDPPLELLEEVWPCQHLDFRLLASRTGREQIYVVSSH